MDELRRKVGLLRDATAKARGVQLKWHDPRATLVEGIASRGDRRIGRVIERVWRAGGTFQEWSEMFDLGRWEEAMAAEGLSIDWYVHRHRTEDEVLPWAHISAGLHNDFLWQDWQAALAESGVEDCRWTPCYDCGVCTGYGLEHVVASPVPPAGGSQGTGQDLRLGAARSAGHAPGPAARAGGRVGGRAGPGAVRQAGQGPLDEPPRRGPHVGAGASGGPRCRWRSPGVLPRPKLSFGLALSTGHESVAEYLDVELAAGFEPDLAGVGPTSLTPALPVGLDVLAAVEIDPRAPSLQQDVTSCTWQLEAVGPSADEATEAVAAALAASELVATRTRKGHEVIDDLRPAILHLARHRPVGGR